MDVGAVGAELEIGGGMKDEDRIAIETRRQKFIREALAGLSVATLSVAAQACACLRIDTEHRPDTGHSARDTGTGDRADAEPDCGQAVDQPCCPDESCHVPGTACDARRSICAFCGALLQPCCQERKAECGQDLVCVDRRCELQRSANE